VILARPPPGPEVVADLASAAGRALPRRVAVAVLGERPAADASTSPALPPGALIDWSRREPCVLIADHDGPGGLARIERAPLGAGQGPDRFPLPRPPPGPASSNMDSIPWRRGHLNPVLEQPILTLDRLLLVCTSKTGTHR